MKIRLILALVGLAISFALPTFAQQTNTPDPQIRQQLVALVQKFDDAYSNNDPAALVALYTEDAVLVTDTGQIYGREAIEKYFVAMRCGKPEHGHRLLKARPSVLYNSKATIHRLLF